MAVSPLIVARGPRPGAGARSRAVGQRTERLANGPHAEILEVVGLLSGPVEQVVEKVGAEPVVSGRDRAQRPPQP